MTVTATGGAAAFTGSQNVPARQHALSQLRIVIIGAGQSGVGMGVKLKTHGFSNFIIYEKGDAVGGVWRENHYPGLHCDLASPAYCYSFALKPDWSMKYSPGFEVRKYFEDVANENDISTHIKLNTSVTAARWDGAAWRITLDDGTTTEADVLISATGVLHNPVYPDIKGLESFSGESFHSARWNHALDLTNMRVGLIGAGSTATQITEELADKVKHLTLFQRTPQWIFNDANKSYSPGWQGALRRFPFLQRWMYGIWSWLALYVATAGITGRNGFARWILVSNCKRHLETVKDAALRAKLTPDFSVGCKRLVRSSEFYKKVQLPSVTVVTGKIDHIEPQGIVGTDGELHEIDVLVLATGFDAMAYGRPLAVTGENGVTLDDVWRDGPMAYIGMSVPHMPNFFMLNGPPNAVNQISPILTAEMQAERIMEYIRYIEHNNVSIAPREDVTVELLQEYREVAKKTVWGAGGCKSWYLDANGIPHVYPFDYKRFKADTLSPMNPDDFVIEPLGSGTYYRQPIIAR